MRTAYWMTWLCIAALQSSPSLATQPHPIKLDHPGDTALTEDSPGKFVYKSFPGLERLYMYDRDRAGQSNCNDDCTSPWPPLLVSAREKGPVGDWTIINRADGTRQWAYKKMPVYTRYHDFPPDEDTAKEGFHLLTP